MVAAAVEAAPPPCRSEPGRAAERIQGEIAQGARFTKTTAGGWMLRLVPTAAGWLVEVGTTDRPSEDLSRLTPPWHGVPNARELDGWHFRNADNTGPNEGDVNAPQQLRELVFSPDVGRGIEYKGSATRPEAVEAVRAFGRGWLFVDAYRLTPPARGQRAAFEMLRFTACLTWPSSSGAS